MNPRDIVILSTADWRNPFWTNKQHVAVQLAKNGHRVLYIDSVGLRRPSVTSRDAARIFLRVLKAFRAPVLVRDRLWVWSPVVIPFHKYAPIRYVNRILIGMGLRFWMKLLNMCHDMLWTYNPLTDQLFDTKRFQKRIYHCVDEIKEMPGLPRKILANEEEKLAKSVDIIFATSTALAASRAKWNKNTHYLPNVADYDHFSKALDPELKIPLDLLKIPPPRAGFIGAISSYKVDFNLICKLAQAKPNLSIVMIGAIGEGDPWTDPDVLKRFPNIYLLGPRRYADLPGYLKGIDVALLPNTLNEYTKAMFPMKFFEYLASGRPVVSVRLDALKQFADVIYIADNANYFITAVDEVLAGNVPDMDARLAIARQNTYEARTEKMLTLIENEITN